MEKYKKLIFIVFLALPILFSCGDPNKEVMTALEGLRGVHVGFFKILEANLANPDLALSKAEQFVKNNEPNLIAYEKALKGILTAQQADMVKRFQTDVKLMAIDSRKKLMLLIKDNEDAKNKLELLYSKLSTYHNVPVDEIRKKYYQEKYNKQGQ